MTAGLTVLCLLLLLALGVAVLLWRSASLTVADQAALIRDQLGRINSQRAELDALSIGGTPVDTVNGSHDRLPIRDDIRATLTAYCERMLDQPAKDKR